MTCFILSFFFLMDCSLYMFEKHISTMEICSYVKHKMTHFLVCWSWNDQQHSLLISQTIGRKASKITKGKQRQVNAIKVLMLQAIKNGRRMHQKSIGWLCKFRVWQAFCNFSWSWNVYANHMIYLKDSSLILIPMYLSILKLSGILIHTQWIPFQDV